VADLYAGAGLFTAPLADAVGETGSVLSVEGSPGTSRDARKNLHGASQVEIVQGRVERVLREKPRNFDALVLDPPRAGAGKAVVNQLIGAGPRAIAYVSCDPASFARDLGYFQQGGWGLAGLRALDLYPHTHHMETVALLTPRR
jgi:tRNA/tmRNA/rRNA uracil-C5-methylase (TrmA/RlmC/RlmD family)